MTVEPKIILWCLSVMTTLAPLLGWGATPSAGCGKSLSSGTYNITDQGVIRTYRVFASGYQSTSTRKEASVRFSETRRSQSRNPFRIKTSLSRVLRWGKLTAHSGSLL